MIKKSSIIVIAIILCQAIGYITSQIQIESIQIWYPNLIKSILTPPSYIFPIVWNLIYILMGISIGLIICNPIKEKKVLLITLFIIQLLFNIIWSILFFYLQSPLLGAIAIIFMDIIVIIYISISYNSDRNISSLLFSPYLLWLLFATYLNIYIVIYN